MGTRDPSIEDTVEAATGVRGRAASDGDVGPMPTGHARYHFGPLLGRGGMGDIMLATDSQIGRDVAIKRMRDLQHASRSRFLREARIQGRLEHPAIVPVHEISLDDEGRPYFVMKRLTGTTLHDILKGLTEVSLKSTSHGGGKHTRSRLLRAFADVCLAVEFAHTRGVIHRDLKPANIMLGDFGEVYVLDWGVARVQGEDEAPASLDPVPAVAGATEAGAVLGTIGYMPPEQLRGLPVDRRADVYALGCILFEILAGQPLHKAGELTAVFDDYDPRPSARVPHRDIPPELDALVGRAAAADPAKRPATARELGETVERYLDGDRDIAQRRRLAREQIELARAALSGDGVASLSASQFARKPPAADERRTAMQHAGRALALDPTTPDAAELVGRLMLEPPHELPPEIDAELDAIDDRNLREQGKVAFGSYLLYLLFIPLMLWSGLDRGSYLVIVTIAAAANGLLVTRLAWGKRRIPSPYLWMLAVGNCALLAILSRMFTPLLVAPGLATATMLGFSMHPRFGKTWLLVAGLSFGALAPWFGELAGLWPHTVMSIGGGLALSSPAGSLDASRFMVAHGLFVVALVAAVGMLARTMARTQRDARRGSHLQTWHLRQLVPVAAPPSDRG